MTGVGGVIGEKTWSASSVSLEGEEAAVEDAGERTAFAALSESTGHADTVGAVSRLKEAAMVK